MAGNPRRPGLSRVFGDGEDPFSWAPTVARVAGIRVRVHVLFIVMAGWIILTSISRDGLGAVYTVSAVAALFSLVLLHEFGHCFAARWVGGEASQIIMWPLGGLASVHVPHRWLPNLIVAVAGPAVNAALAPVFGLALYLSGAPQAVYFNPLHIGATLSGLQSQWLVALFWAHVANLMLLAFNLLVPVFPMDGGRVLQAVLWRRMGWRGSMSVALAVGVAGSVVLGVAGLMTNRMLLVAIAAFTGLTCWADRRRLAAEAALTGAGGGPAWGGAASDMAAERESRQSAARRREKDRERASREQAEEDRILAKIADEGLASLTRSERKTLERATARRRGQ